MDAWNVLGFGLMGFWLVLAILAVVCYWIKVRGVMAAMRWFLRHRGEAGGRFGEGHEDGASGEEAFSDRTGGGESDFGFDIEGSMWMAWVPVVDLYALARCVYPEAGNVRQEMLDMELPVAAMQWQAAIFWGASVVISRVPVLGAISTLVMAALRVVLFGQMYRDVMRKMGAEVSVGEVIVGAVVPVVAYVRLKKVAEE